MKQLARFIKPFTFSIITVFILIFLQSLSELYLPTLMADIVDKGIANGDTRYILKTGGFMLVIAGIGAVVTILSSLLSSKISVGFGKNIRSAVFTHVEKFSLEEFDNIGTASLITRTTNDINQIQQVLIMVLRMMVSAPMMAIGGIIMATSKDAKLSLILVFVIPIVVGVISLIGKKGVPLFRVMQLKLDKLNLVVREGLVGIRVIRAFNRDDYEKERFDDANSDITNTAIKVNQIMGALMPSMMLILNFTTIGIIWFGANRINSGNMQVGDLMAFIQYVMQIMFSLIMVSMMFVMIPRAMVSANRINEVLNRVPSIEDPKKTKDTKDKKGVVEFKNVTFSYNGAETPVLSNISFSSKPGEVTAIIGGTGSGKSTMINLIPRFYDVLEGSVLVNGIDVREMSQESLREKIGYVPQKAILFSGTIAENIRYGKDDATDDELRYAADIAQATEFISQMKDGFNSEIAQGGTNISGGQKQRLSIARALVRKPEIYIFDDSFSALDFKTDAKLREALKSEVDDATMLIVAQRVATVMDADQIIVLHEGNIVGKGKHKELLAGCEVYREIVFSQLSKEEIA